MTITLQREESPALSQPLGERGSWPLRITAFLDEEKTQPAKIFVYQRAGLGSSLEGDSFATVADFLGMTELPADAPTDDCPYFRVNTVNVVCRSKDHLHEFWSVIAGAVRMLVDETEAANTLLEIVDTITIAPR